MRSSADVVVLGAGPAGLMAAWQAAEAGRQVVVVERSTVPGGMAGSFEIAGVRVDFGSHRLHPSIDPEILGLLRRLLGDDLQTRERHGRIRLADRWIAFPLRPGDMVRHLPRPFAARAIGDTLTSPLRRPRRDTFAEVVRARLGPTVAREFYDPYIRKLWDADPDDLSGELARRRVSASSPADVARRLLRGRTPEGRSFLYPRRGFGQVSEALADAAVEEGADVRLSTAVEGVRIHDDGNGVALTLADGSVIEAAMAWSTVPLPALVGMADPAPPADVAAAAAVLRHRALLLVYLVLDRSHYTEFDAHYFPGLDVPMARLSEPRNYRHDPDAPPSTTVLCAEVPCWEGDDHWNASPDDLAALVADGLARAGLPPVGPVAVEIRRLPRVYPVYRPGFEADVAAVQAWEDAQPALVSFGRQGLFVPDNTHHALAMGTAAAACLGDRFDDAAWRAARDGFAAHVVED